MCKCKRLIDKSIKFLLTPSKAFDSEKRARIEDAFKYMAALSLVTAVLTGVIYAALTGLYTGLIILAVAYIGIIFASVVFGLWLHLWAYLLGAKKGLNQTLKAVFYANTPAYLLGWIAAIPFSYFFMLSILLNIWEMVLSGMGIKKFHGIATEKAALAVIIAVAVPAAIALLLGALLYPYIAPLM